MTYRLYHYRGDNFENGVECDIVGDFDRIHKDYTSRWRQANYTYSVFSGFYVTYNDEKYHDVRLIQPGNKWPDNWEVKRYEDKPMIRLRSVLEI